MCLTAVRCSCASCACELCPSYPPSSHRTDAVLASFHIPQHYLLQCFINAHEWTPDTIINPNAEAYRQEERVFMYWYFFLQMCFMWCETTSGMSPFMSFVEGTHLHQRLHRSKTFCNKVPLVLKQASLSTGRAVVFYLEDFLAFLHVKSNPLQGSLSSLNTLSKSLVLLLGLFVISLLWLVPIELIQSWKKISLEISFQKHSPQPLMHTQWHYPSKMRMK